MRGGARASPPALSVVLLLLVCRQSHCSCDRRCLFSSSRCAARARNVAIQSSKLEDQSMSSSLDFISNWPHRKSQRQRSAKAIATSFLCNLSGVFVWHCSGLGNSVMDIVGRLLPLRLRAFQASLDGSSELSAALRTVHRRFRLRNGSLCHCHEFRTLSIPGAQHEQMLPPAKSIAHS